MYSNETIPPKWINTPESLLQTSEKISRYPSISVDTESNSLYVYHEKVCLLQISTVDDDFLIDTLALRDLSPLAGIFSNPAQEKVFHASEYDVICLKRDFSFQFANIFDTMIAARILGIEAVGLGSLLNSYLGITLDKKFQKANWGIRPLSQAMLNYASQDSHSLYPLRVILENELRQRNLWELALEDFKLACEVQAHAPNQNQNNCWKVAGATGIDPQQAAVLQALCAFREEQAIKHNLPPFKILSNEVLVRVSQLQPKTVDELKEIHGFSNPLVERFGASILAIVANSKNAEPICRPRRTRPDEKYLIRLDALREWRKLKGKELKVESDVILPREMMELISAKNPLSEKDLHVLMATVPWRHQHFGKEILSLLKKKEKL